MERRYFSWDGVVIVIGVALITIAAGYLGQWFGGSFTFDAKATDNLLARLQQMGLLTVVIERVVEVYLSASNQNGPDRHDPNDTSDADASQPAAMASLALGVLMAVAGVRVLSALGQAPGENYSITRLIWNGVDIVLSGGLLAGGSKIMHEITESIIGMVKRVDPSSMSNPGGGAVETRQKSAADIMKPMDAAPGTVNSDAQRIIGACKKIWPGNHAACNSFAISVAGDVGVGLNGRADDIADQIKESTWIQLADGVAARDAATQGKLVVAAMKSADFNPPRSEGHVAIVVPGPMNAGGWAPAGYWGSTDPDTAVKGGNGDPISLCWRVSDKDSIGYASHDI